MIRSNPCYLAGTQAARAHVNRLVRAVYNSLNASDVGLPHSVGLAVGVGNILTESYAFAADRAFCHVKYTSVYSKIIKF